jgi:hypothetical protein
VEAFAYWLTHLVFCARDSTAFSCGLTKKLIRLLIHGNKDAITAIQNVAAEHEVKPRMNLLDVMHMYLYLYVTACVVVLVCSASAAWCATCDHQACDIKC